MGEVHHGAAWGGQKKTADGGEPPNDGSRMEDRLKKIEALIPTLATKADVEKGFHDLVKWVVGTAFVGMGLALTIMTFVLNNAVPKQPVPPAPAAQVIQAPVPQPIIIQIPPQPQAVAPAKAPPSPAKP